MQTLRRIKSYATIGALLLTLQMICAEVLHVPEEYGSIQSALDATSVWDTVLISPGVYDEFLVGPEHSFVISGLYTADTTIALRTILNPSPPTNADTPSVFVVAHDTAVVKNLAFFNRVELRQPDWATRSGGIRNFAQHLIVEDCRFDSVSAAIDGGAQINASDCIFQDCVFFCIRPINNGRVNLANCTFDGAGYSLIYSGSYSTIENCRFVCNSAGGHFLQVSGSGVRVQDCTFGPCVGAFSILEAGPDSNIVIERCLFIGLDRAICILSVYAECSDSIEPIEIRDNIFEDYHTVPPASGVMAIFARCSNFEHGKVAVIRDNVFRNGDGSTVWGTGVSLQGNSQLLNNVFEDLNPEDRPDVQAEGTALDSVVARFNQFLLPGLAASTASAYFDARENWWGDSTGPFNANANPMGQGAQVGNGILFEPWLTMHPDSGDTSEVAIETETLPVPQSYALSVFPNPFNSATTLTLEVPHAGHYELRLFDVTGRTAAVLFDGVVSSRTSLHFNGGSLASGLYLAQLSEGDTPRATAKLLLLK